MPSRHKGQPTARPSLDVLLSADATCPTADQLSFRALPRRKHGMQTERCGLKRFDFKTAIEFDSLMGWWDSLMDMVNKTWT